jgi:hypothetical protein
MRRPILILALALFAIPSFAQQQSIDNQSARDNLGLVPWPNDFPVPTPPLRPAINPNPAFPLRVKLALQDTHFNYFWSDFRGRGQFAVDNTTFNFRYECPDTFRQPNQFQARWTKNGKQLDVLLQKRGSAHTEVCTLNILNHS